MRILCDMDEVVVNLMDSWLETYAELGGEHKTREEIHSYKLEGQFSRMDKLWSAIDLHEALLRASPLTDAVPAVYQLMNAFGPEFFLVTYARHQAEGEAHAEKLMWLRSFIPEFNRDNVIFTRHKHMIVGDILIEDSTENLETWLNEMESLGLAPRGFLIDQPWNQNWSHPLATRVPSLYAAARIILDSVEKEAA